MNTITLGILLPLVMAGVIVAGEIQQEDIPVKGYKLVWSDEFDGTSLDMEKWGYRQLGPRHDGVTVTDTVTLNGEGQLVLTTKKSGDAYHTAMIGTQGKFETTFGYFEARIKLQQEYGHWSAFWLQSPTIGKPLGNTAVAGTEVDIYEYHRKLGKDVIVHNLHWDGYKKDHKKTGGKATVPGITQGWHTFGVLWTEAGYVFYIDGEETWRTQKAISKRSLYIILSMEVGKWAGDISKAKLPDSLYVDYVRVYQPDDTGPSAAVDDRKYRILDQQEEPMIVAHRGASRDAPENTLPAFELAWEQGADAIEADIHLTSDGQIVCIHDANTKRVSHTNIVVKQSTLADLQAVDVGLRKGQAFKGTRIPTIADVFATIPEQKTIYIEVKCGVEIIPSLLKELDASGLTEEQVVIISFKEQVLQELKVQAPQYRTSWLCEFNKQKVTGVVTPSVETVLETLRHIRADGLSSNTNVSESIIEAVRKKGYQWHVWTVDDPKTAERMEALGAKSITTNIPGFIRKKLVESLSSGEVWKAAPEV